MKGKFHKVVAKMVIVCLVVSLTGCAKKYPPKFVKNVKNGVAREEKKYRPISTSFDVGLTENKKNNQYNGVTLMKTGMCEIEKRKIYHAKKGFNNSNGWYRAPDRCFFVGILTLTYGWWKCFSRETVFFLKYNNIDYLEPTEEFIEGYWSPYNPDARMFETFEPEKCPPEPVSNKEIQLTLLNKDKTDTFWEFKEKTDEKGVVNFSESQKSELTKGLSNVVRKGDKSGVMSVTGEGINKEFEIDAISQLPFEKQLYAIGPKKFSLGHIIEHIAEGLSEKIIISKIKKSKTAYRDFSMKEVKILQMIDVSDNIIQAMIDVIDADSNSSSPQNTETGNQDLTTQSGSQPETTAAVPAKKEGLDDKIAACVSQTAALKLCEKMSWPASLVCEKTAMAGGNKCF